MKKIFAVFINFILVVFFCTAASVENIYSTVKAVDVFSTGEQLSGSDADWLPNAVEEKLISNLSKYTDFEIVSNSNKKAILKIQKDFESGIYDDSSSLEVGKLTSASHGIFLTLRKVSGKYIASISFTDLTTGKNLATLVGSQKNSIEELYINNGCSIDELTIELCELLNIPLSSSKRYKLLHGDFQLSDADRTSIAEEEITNYSAQIIELDNEIDSLSQQTDFASSVREAQLRIEKNKAEERLRKAKDDIKRAEEEVQKRRDDEIRDMKRTQEQKDRINKKSDELDKKLKEVQTQEIERAPLLSQIGMIESIKKTYVDINNEIEAEQKAAYEAAQKEIDKEAILIEEEPLKFADKDKYGNITETAQKNREQRLADFSEARLKEASDYISDYKSSFAKQQKSLINEINKNYKRLKTRTISTLTNDLIVTFSNYDGNRYGWDLDITVQSDDIILFKTTSFLSYETITGNKPAPGYRDAGHEEYNDQVDFLVSMFSRGDPYLIFALDFDVTPFDNNSPSKYNFSFSNFRFYKTEKIKLFHGAIISSPTDYLILEEVSVDRQMTPPYDLRSPEDIRKEEQAIKDSLWEQQQREMDKMYREEMEEYLRYQEEYLQDLEERENTENNNDYESYDDSYNQKKKDYGRTLIGFNYGVVSGTLLGQNLQLEFSYGFLPNIYGAYKFDLLLVESDKSARYPIKNNLGAVLANKFELGYEGNVLGDLDLYCSFGLGFNCFLPDDLLNSDVKDILNGTTVNNIGYSNYYGSDPYYNDDPYYNEDPYYSSDSYYSDPEYGNNSQVTTTLPKPIIDFTVGFTCGMTYTLWNHFAMSCAINYYFLPSDNAKGILPKDELNTNAIVNFGVGYRF